MTEEQSSTASWDVQSTAGAVHGRSAPSAACDQQHTAGLPQDHSEEGALPEDALDAVNGGTVDDQSLGDVLYDWAARVFGPAPK